MAFGWLRFVLDLFCEKVIHKKDREWRENMFLARVVKSYTRSIQDVLFLSNVVIVQEIIWTGDNLG